MRIFVTAGLVAFVTVVGTVGYVLAMYAAPLLQVAVNS